MSALSEVFADADYASKTIDSLSVSGGAVMCEGSSRTRKCVNLSTSEVEYVALGTL